jgi:hypothetical protein
VPHQFLAIPTHDRDRDARRLKLREHVTDAGEQGDLRP